MSDAGREGRLWRLYVQDMIEFGEKVLVYTDGLDQEAFITDELTYDATLRNLQLIGEAATHIPDEVRQTHRGSLARHHRDAQSPGPLLSGDQR